MPHFQSSYSPPQNVDKYFKRSNCILYAQNHIVLSFTKQKIYSNINVYEAHVNCLYNSMYPTFQLQ